MRSASVCLTLKPCISSPHPEFGVSSGVRIDAHNVSGTHQAGDPALASTGRDRDKCYSMELEAAAIVLYPGLSGKEEASRTAHPETPFWDGGAALRPLCGRAAPQLWAELHPRTTSSFDQSSISRRDEEIPPAAATSSTRTPPSTQKPRARLCGLCLPRTRGQTTGPLDAFDSEVAAEHERTSADPTPSDEVEEIVQQMEDVLGIVASRRIWGPDKNGGLAARLEVEFYSGERLFYAGNGIQLSKINPKKRSSISSTLQKLRKTEAMIDLVGFIEESFSSGWG